MARKHGRAWRIAQANAELRYSPQERTLHSLVGQARRDLRTDERVAAGQAATTIQGARQSRKQLRKIYGQAASGIKSSQGDLSAAFGRAGVGADNPFALAADRENASYRQRLTSAAARARQDTVRQENEARLGKLFALGAARQRFNSTVSQLRQQGLDLSGEKRMFLLSELGKHQEAAAGRRTQEKIAETYAAAKGKGSSSGKGKSKFDPASRSEGRLFSTDFNVALDYAKQYATGNTPRAKTAQILRRGVAASQKNNTARVPQIRNQLALSVALDMAYRGYVGRENVKRLHQNGIRLDSVGAITKAQWARRLKAQQLKASKKRAKQYQQGNVY